MHSEITKLMRLGFVFLIWAAVGLVLATAAAIILSTATALLTRGVPRGRLESVLAAFALPFACLAWAGLIFIFQAIVNEAALDRDVGLGDTWHCPLPNGYHLLMIDVTDHGVVYDPKLQKTPGAVADSDGAVSDVRVLQVAGPYLLGGTGGRTCDDPSKEVDRLDSFFILDSRTGTKSLHLDYDSLRNSATQLGILPKLETINSVYCKYRFSWLDVVFGVFLFLLPVVCFVLLGGFVLRLRRGRQSPVLAHTT
jgi:hypothetical protein